MYPASHLLYAGKLKTADEVLVSLGDLRKFLDLLYYPVPIRYDGVHSLVDRFHRGRQLCLRDALFELGALRPTAPTIRLRLTRGFAVARVLRFEFTGRYDSLCFCRGHAELPAAAGDRAAVGDNRSRRGRRHALRFVYE